MNKQLLEEMKDKVLFSAVPPKYAEFFLEILSMDKAKISSYLLKKGVGSSEYHRNLIRFKNNFPDAIEEYKFLEQIYFDYYNIADSKKKNESFEILEKIVKSGYSIEEYCSKNGILISNINAIINRHSNCNYVKKISNILKNRDKTNFYNLIDNIVLDMQREDFDAIDYYMQTKLDFDEFKRIIKERIKDVGMLQKVGKFCSVQRQNSYNYIGKKSVINGKIIIEGREFTKEEKEKCFIFLEENNIPFWAYKYYFKKQINGNQLIK